MSALPPAGDHAEPRVLVVDDSPLITALVERMLSDAGYSGIVTTNDSRETLELCEQHRPDVVLVDLNMPPPDGFAILERIRPNGHAGPAVIVLTGSDGPANRRRALELGAAELLPKPIEGVELLLRLRNVLETRRHVQELERLVRSRTEDLEAARIELLQRMALAAELRDEETHAHTRRVGRIAFLLAERLVPDQAELIADAAPLHDIGKIGVPDAILLKPGALTPDDLAIMREHPEIGRRILAGSHAPVLRLAEVIAYGHHERWDGTGYPRGVARERIPLAARIVAVADAFDAMTHERPYRPAMTVAEAVAEVRRGSGSHFDPAVAEAFDQLDHASLVDDP